MKDGVQYKAFLNPYTRKILHHGKRYDYWMGWLLFFHYTFTFHIWVELAVAICSLTLLVSLITGLHCIQKIRTKSNPFQGYREIQKLADQFVRPPSNRRGLVPDISRHHRSHCLLDASSHFFQLPLRKTRN
jgi:hypothetical protein